MNRIDSSDPYGQCSYLNTDNLWEQQKHTVSEHLSRQQLKDHVHKNLHKQGYYSVPNNGFTEMKFGANKNGLNSACAICLLHTFKQRFPNDICDIVIGMFGSSEGTVSKLMVEKTMPKLLSRCKRQIIEIIRNLTNFSEGSPEIISMMLVKICKNICVVSQHHHHLCREDNE